MGVVAIRDFFPWLRQKESFKSKSTFCCDPVEALAFKSYAIEIAISRLANAVAMSNFETFQKGKILHENYWWRFNFEPNKNQNKAAFWNTVIREMVFNPDGALVVQTDKGEWICAESYTLNTYSDFPNAYKDITLYGGWRLTSIHNEQDILHFTLQNSQVKRIIDDVYSDYGKLIGGSIRNYNRGNAMKVIVKLGAMFNQFKSIKNEDGSTEYDFILDDIMKNRMRGLLSDSDSATPIEDGLEIQEVQTSSNGRNGAVTTRDITATFDDIMNIVADAFHIPRGLMKGDVADVEAITANYINLAINPLTEEIENEINRKIYGKKLVIEGTKLRVDTSTIFTRDPIKFANAAEAMFRIGAYSTNDIRRKMGEEIIEEDWANEYYVTKNYERINAHAENEES